MARRVRLAERYGERKSNFDLIRGQMCRFTHIHVRACARTHIHTHTASRVLDLQALFTSSDKVDVLETAGCSLVDKVLQKDSERLALGGRSM